MTSEPARSILLIEDNPGDAEFITELLAEAGVGSVLHAGSLETAAAHLATSSVAAVLLDLHLPDGSGVDCVRAVRGRAAEVPVVVLTGVDDESLARSCLAAGAQDYLPKGDLRTPALRRAIAHAVARSAESAQRRRADALQSRLAAIVEASSDAIVSCTLDGIITSWNPGAARLFGHASDEAIGRSVVEVLPPLGDEGEAGRGATDDGAVGERTWVTADGRVLTMSMASSTLRDERGLATARAAIFRDVTAQKQLETQLAASDRMVSIGTLAAGVAHEINNPLAALIANLQLMGERLALPELVSAPPDVRDLLADAQDAAQRVARIVSDLKTFSRAEDLALGPVDVARVLDATLRLVDNEIRHRAITVKEYAPVPPVHANASRLGQVLLNLLVNAAQSIPTGASDRHRITVATSVGPAGQVLVRVTDTGSGMPAEVQRRLFTAFFTTKPVGVGTGLGLAISQRIVTSFGGTISFESEVGRGTSFVVSLRPSVTPLLADTAAPPQSARAGGRRAAVLIVDDDRGVLRILTRILRAEHEVTALDDAAQALDLVRNGAQYDVILCDLMMPRLSGAEFYDALARLRPGYEARVVFITGGAFTGSAAAFLDSLPNRQVAKPFDWRALRALVQEVLP